jgi:hypothetical protein
MPSLIQRDRPFGLVLSRLKMAELLVLAGALGLEVAHGATVLHLREMAKWKLQDDAPLYIYNPDYQNLYTRRELQVLRQAHPAEGEAGGEADPQVDNQDDSVSQAHSHHSRSESADAGPRSAPSRRSERGTTRASMRPAQNAGEQAAAAGGLNDAGGDGPESSGEICDVRLPVMLGPRSRERLRPLSTRQPSDGRWVPLSVLHGWLSTGMP